MAGDSCLSWVAQGFIFPRALVPPIGLTPPFKLRNPKYHSTKHSLQSSRPRLCLPAFCHVTGVQARPILIAQDRCPMTTEVAARDF